MAMDAIEMFKNLPIHCCSCCAHGHVHGDVHGYGPHALGPINLAIIRG
jgi:hypothetical protein